MKSGDIVKHKLAGITLQIKNINECVATCYRIEEPKEWNMRHQRFEYQINICSVDNLEAK